MSGLPSEASEKCPEKKSRKYSTGSRLKKWFLTVGRTKLVAMSQLLARWKDIQLHLPENRLGLRFARAEGKVGGGEKCVRVPQDSLRKNFFIQTRHLWTPRNFCRALMREGRERLRDSETPRDTAAADQERPEF